MSSALVLRDNNIDSYMAEVRKIPLLSRTDEVALARRFRDEGDVGAAHKLVVANLRFVVKIAHQYRDYGLKLLDLIQEGNIGLMTAVKKYDPDKGYRLISYAVWWIRAQIQSYIMKSWSLVKLGTGKTRRKLFFKLRSTRSKAQQAAGQEGLEMSRQELADDLGVRVEELDEMEVRMAARDFSLDATIGPESRVRPIDMLPTHDENQEEALGDREEALILRRRVDDALNDMNDKERHIVEHRLLSDEPQTLQEIGETFSVSRERIRQLEQRVLGKLRGKLQDFSRASAAA